MIYIQPNSSFAQCSCRSTLIIFQWYINVSDWIKIDHFPIVYVLNLHKSNSQTDTILNVNGLTSCGYRSLRSCSACTSPTYSSLAASSSSFETYPSISWRVFWMLLRAWVFREGRLRSGARFDVDVTVLYISHKLPIGLRMERKN